MSRIKTKNHLTVSYSNSRASVSGRTSHPLPDGCMFGGWKLLLFYSLAQPTGRWLFVEPLLTPSLCLPEFLSEYFVFEVLQRSLFFL